MHGRLAGPLLDGMAQRRAGHPEVGIARKIGGRHLVVGEHHRGVIGLDGLQHLVGGRHHEIAAEHQVGARHAGADGMDLIGGLGNAHVAGHRAALLGEPRHVDRAEALALQMRRLAEHGRQRHHARAANARHQHGVGVVERRQRRLGQARQHAGNAAVADGLAGLLDLGAVHGDEARAEAVEAGEVLVAGGLVDGALGAELGLERHHRHAVRLDAAVAAALAHRRVDEHALVGIGEQAALAAPALLGRAGLIVDQDRHARHLAQLLLQGLDLAAVVDRHALRDGAEGILVRLVGDDDHLVDALRQHLVDDHRHGHAAVERLAAGHGHGVVVEDLEGHVDAGRARGADGEAAGVDVGAVAQVLEDVRGLGEGRLADPVAALPAHLGEALGRAVHPVRHVVAADAGIGARAFGHDGGGVVRAARAEIGDAHGGFGRLGTVALEALQLGDARLDVLAGAGADQPLADLDGDVAGIERVLGREQPLLVLVLLAEHARALGQIVKLLLDLGLDQRALLLDDQDQVEAFGELQHALRLERPRHADLVEAQAELVGLDLVDAELVHRRAHVEIALAAGDDADLGILSAAGDEAVELVGAGEGEDGRALVIVQARLLVERLIAEPDVQALGGHDEIVGDLDLDAIDAPVDRRGGLDVVLDALDADPHAGEAREREAQHAVVEDLLHAGRIEHGDHVVDEGELGLVGAGRAFAGVVVAHQGQHATVLGGAGVVGVAEYVAGAVEAGALAVPHTEHAVVLALASELGLLRAPQGRGCQVLVEAGHELDVVGLEDALGAQHRRLQRGDRRAAVARDVASRIEPGLHVAGALRQHQAHDRLRAGQQLPRLVEGILVVEGDCMLGHVEL